MTASEDRSRDIYENPLATRYASQEMLRLFGPARKFGTWRRLWVALARAQHDAGLTVSAEQVAELEGAVDDIDHAVAEAREREVRHDVMAHVHAYGIRCPGAAPIIHLGATSAYVVDNTDLILLREAYDLVRARLVGAIDALAGLAERTRDVPCLSYTHFQPAQPTTFGRRVCLWIQELLLDLEECIWRRDQLRFLGVKGTTGTQASFLTLFEGDHDKVERLDRAVADEMGFARLFPVTGQTPSRKIDAHALSMLSGVAQSAHKFANDIRLLMGLGCVEEPWRAAQIGSSAMAYKKNPMRSERMTSLARLVIALSAVPAQTAAEQWFERTLDDSAAKRIVVPEAFLAVDAILVLLENVARGLTVFPAALRRELVRELPAMATEEILMLGVAAGGDRQDLHERIRVHAHAAARRVKEEGVESDLMSRVAADPAFAAVAGRFEEILVPSRHVGRSPEQVDAFLRDHVRPALAANADVSTVAGGEVSV